MNWSVTTPTTTTVLTWDQIEAHVRPGSTAEQTYLMDLLASATTRAETMMQCCLLPQTITAIYDQRDIGCYAAQFAYGSFESQGWKLPRGPVISITSVTDALGHAVTYKLHTAGNADYILSQQPISLQQTPITVVFQAGFTTVPADILNAIRVDVGTTYMYREDITSTPANSVHKIDEFYRYRGRGTMVY